MLRPMGGICPLRSCGTYEKSQSPIPGQSQLEIVAEYYTLCDDCGIGPSFQFPVTSNYTTRSMLLTMLDEGLGRDYESLICTLPLLQ